MDVILLFNSIDFEYNGVRGSYMGIGIVSIDNSGQERPFAVTRKIIEQQVRSDYYFNRVDLEPLTFKLTFCLLDDTTIITNDKRRELIRWLFPNTYKPFISDDFPSITFWCIPTNAPSLWDTGFFQGYFSIEFRCNAGTAWSNTSNYNRTFINNSVGTTIQYFNPQNIWDVWYPKIYFKLLNDSTSFQIINLSDGGNIFNISGLDKNEEIYIDFKLRQIKTSKGTGIYRLSNCNKNWLRFVRGNNFLKIIGDCTLTIMFSAPIAV